MNQAAARPILPLLDRAHEPSQGEVARIDQRAADRTISRNNRVLFRLRRQDQSRPFSLTTVAQVG
jgi:hypothetical protein